LPQLRRLYNGLIERDLNGRRKTAGIGPRRAEIIIPGAAVFIRVLEAFNMQSMYYSTAGVRDGIIADLNARGVGRELTRLSREQLEAAQALARKFGVQPRHGRRVSDLAHALFECLAPVHKLAPEYGKILEAAAYLHDIGHYVSDTGHHKHSQYLVLNADLPGFTDKERLLVSLLCRYHRKTMPTARHMPFQSLPAELKRAVVQMTPLLRLADALDTSKEQHVGGLTCTIRNGTVQVTLSADENADLELWAAERAGAVFREVYDRPIAFVRRRGGNGA
jgi:exopolyphosphatase/guanosine-5'-triphosphate,3'-diphosphate pyrophosphatase